MDWTIINEITHHPAFLAVVSILSILGSALAIISKTSFGKKAIRKLTDLVNKGDERISQFKETIDDVSDTVQSAKQEIVDFKEEVKQEVKTYFNQLEFFEESIYSIIEQIPNEKVKAQLKTFKEKWKEKKKEIQDFVGGSYLELDNQLKQLEEKKNDEIASLRSEIEELKQLVVQAVKTAETTENGERKETINEETNEE